VWNRFPFPYIQMNPQNMAELGLKAGDLAEIYNDNESTQAMVWPTASAKRNQTFMLFCLSNRRGRQCDQQGRERASDPELQTDLGKYSQACGCAAGDGPPAVQE
jgi:anaerobic selenocysteine-containing dehydrogenase